MDRTATAVGVGPQLLDRADKTRRSVGDDEERAPQAPPGQTPPEVEPVLCSLPLTQGDIEQHPHPVGREAPGHEHAFSWAVRPDRQVDGVHEQREQADLGEAPGAEG